MGQKCGSLVPEARSAFSAAVELAGCAALTPGDWIAIDKLAAAAGHAAAREGAVPASALVDLADTARPMRTHQLGVRWVFERAFWEASSDPGSHHCFAIQPNWPWVSITSTGVAGASGTVILHRSAIDSFFYRLRGSLLDDYDAWARDSEPTGGRTVFARYGSPWAPSQRGTSEPRQGMLFIDPDCHPSRGRIYFGEPAQEARQVAALLALEGAVRKAADALGALISGGTEGSAAWIKAHRAASGGSWIPDDGCCPTCHSFVATQSNATLANPMTGCPACGASWCE